MKIFSSLFLLALALFFGGCARSPYSFSAPGTSIGAYHKPAATTPVQIQQKPETSEPVFYAAATFNAEANAPHLAAKAESLASTTGKQAKIMAAPFIPALITGNATKAFSFPGVLPPSPPKETTKTRSKILAAILAIPPLGMLGLHRFYLGYYFIGALQLALTIVAIAYAPPPLLVLVFCWVITDLIRIAVGVLEPNNGEYRK